MKRNLFYVFATLTFLASCSKKEEKREEKKASTDVLLPRTNLEIVGLKGKVKTYKEIVYGALVNADGVVEEDMNTTSDVYIYTFKPDGNLDKEQKIDNNGNEISLETYVYNDKGLLVEVYKEGPSIPKYREVLREYDKNGFTATRTLYQNDGTLLYKEVYKPDSRGNELEIFVEESNLEYSKKGSLAKSTYTDLSTFGRFPKENVFTRADGSIVRRIVHTYNKDNQKLTVSSYDSSNINLSQEKFGYDDKGMTVEYQVIVNVESDGFLKKDAERKETYENEYDSTGNLVRQITYVYEKPDYVKKAPKRILKREYKYY